MGVEGLSEFNISQLLVALKNKLNELNRDLTKLIGKKSVYGEISIDEVTLLTLGFISFYYSRALTEDEIKKVLETLRKYFGDISHYHIYKNYKTEIGKYGLRPDNYEFVAYIKKGD